jgi:hypothetical protein
MPKREDDQTREPLAKRKAIKPISIAGEGTISGPVLHFVKRIETQQTERVTQQHGPARRT